jgi:phage terminase large subunit
MPRSTSSRKGFTVKATEKVEKVRTKLVEYLEKQLAASRSAGCPDDQWRNFAKADIWLQPKQLRASAAARSCDREDGPDEIAYGGARGGGKSAWSLAQVIADDCVRRPGLKVLFLRKIGKSAREALQDLRQKLLMKVPHRFAANSGVIRLENGSTIITGHFDKEKDVDKYLGLEYDVIVLEEATTVSQSAFKAIKTCCRTSRPDWRPRMYLTTNPGGIGHAWFKKRFVGPYRAKNETSTRFIPATVDDNRLMHKGYVKNLEDLTGWKLKAWRHGDWEVAAGQYFTTFSERHHIVDEIDNRLAVSWGLSLDYGFTHFTVVTLGFKDGDGRVFIVDQHTERQWLVERHAEAINRMIARQRWQGRALDLGDMTFKVAGSDIFGKESRATSVADDYKKEGISWRPASMDRVNGWAEILKLLGDPENGKPPRMFIHRRCSRLTDGITAAVHSETNPEDVLKVDCDEDGVGGDDAIDSLRYWVAKKIQPVEAVKMSGF